MPDRASLGFALIARNAAATLPICLDSIRPYVAQIVVGVDDTTTDDTAAVARAHGADVVESVHVSDWHECPQHGRILAQHFANARIQSFKLLDPSLDFHGWIDSDDYVSQPHLLADVCARIKDSDAVGAWLSYHYATMRGGTVTNTLFHRERILRTRDQHGNAIGWTWKHRVHEVVVPECAEPPQWLMLQEPAIYHQEKGGHDAQSSSRRNLTLLEIDLEENPDDQRAIFYMGNQYFAMGNWRAAAAWYERTGATCKNHYELWQAWCYCSLAYERLGDLDNATKAAFCAIDVEPRHPEPYYRLASIYLLSGDFGKVEYWTEQAQGKGQPPFFVFKNPLDYTFNSKMPLADALAAQGKVRAAREVLQDAYQALPDERVGKAIIHYQGLEVAEEKATAFARVTGGLVDAEVVRLWETLDFDADVRQFGRARNRVMPAYLRLRTGDSPRVVIWCRRTHEKWSPLSLTTTGIGGSETAVVEIARRFACDGWRVDVYNSPGCFEGVYDGVGYWEHERLRSDETCDLFVSWRAPEAMLQTQVRSPKAILWLHDLTYGPQATEYLRGWDQTPGAVVCGVSAWHAAYLRQCYDLEHTDFLPNGVDLALFGDEAPRKEPFQLVYASSPDRGLERLLTLWPRILAREPGATLKVCYGWENVDKAIESGHQELATMKRRIVSLIERSEGVEWLGRLPKSALAEVYRTSAAWAYPTSFLETFCIAALEAMAGGAVAVTSTVGALRETIGDAGLLVPGMPGTKAWQEMWVEVLLGCLTAPQLRWPLVVKGRQRVYGYTWEKAYEKWGQVIAGLERPVTVAEVPQLEAPKRRAKKREAVLV